MEYQIGTTDLRQKLTDVLESVREEGATYVIETFGRPQAAIVSMEQYQRVQEYEKRREAFFDWLEEAARINAEYNADLTEEEILALIEQARTEVYQEKMKAKSG
jgi:prevent-host-death family protein